MDRGHPPVVRAAVHQRLPGHLPGSPGGDRRLAGRAGPSGAGAAPGHHGARRLRRDARRWPTGSTRLGRSAYGWATSRVRRTPCGRPTRSAGSRSPRWLSCASPRARSLRRTGRSVRRWRRPTTGGPGPACSPRRSRSRSPPATRRPPEPLPKRWARSAPPTIRRRSARASTTAGGGCSSPKVTLRGAVRELHKRIAALAGGGRPVRGRP